MPEVAEQELHAVHEAMREFNLFIKPRALRYWAEPTPIPADLWGEIRIDVDADDGVVQRHRMFGQRGLKTRLASPVEALASLENIGQDASSMGHPVPDEAAVEEARRILQAMHDYRQLSYDAYSMADGRVGIGVNGGPGRSMILVCEPAGKALCAITVDRVSRRARYDDSSFLPDDFVKQGLRQLSRGKTLGPVG